MEIIRYYLTGSFNMHKHSHLPQSKSFQSLTKQKNPLKSIRALSQNEMRAFFFFKYEMDTISHTQQNTHHYSSFNLESCVEGKSCK